MRLATALRFPLASLAALMLTTGIAAAQPMPDPVGLAVVDAGHAKVRLTVTAGASGAPYGFTVCWMTASDFAAIGSSWPNYWAPKEGWGDFTGVGTLNTWGSATQPFQLAPNEALDVEIGDLADESGVDGTTTGELQSAQSYVFCVYPIGPNGPDPAVHGTISTTLTANTSPQGQNCTFTVGFWKTHPEAWPVTSLTLGTVTYSQADLLSILGEPVGGNGLISLAHQLIAAKLNIAQGADPSAASAAIASADALIGGLVVPPVGSGFLSPASTSSLTQTLDDYNNGITGPGHCANTPARHETWGSVKSSYR
jgi:hypothetical protein